MKEKAFSTFKNLKPNQKGIVVLLGVGVVLTMIGLAAYFSNTPSSKQSAGTPQHTRSTVVSMDNDLLKKNQLMEAQKEATTAKEALEDALKKHAEEKEKEKKQAGPPTPAVQPPLPPPLPQRAAAAALPPPPMPPQAQNGNGFPPAPVPPPAPTLESEIGGISITENAKASTKNSEKEDKKKDEKRTVLLPISYMEATLLSGLDAPTSGDAKGNPVPVLIRVKTPAVLPNDVKANLRGCFVVADGKGNLGTERAELVLVTLSCIDRKGQSVIDQALTGYVVDADGKAGLRGRVVTKMGAMVTRSMIAGLFGGFGDAMKRASTTTSLSALGSVQDIKPEKLGMAGIGSGLSSAFKDIQKFYMELAHQTMPVVEIGSARPITLVVTKSAALEIKKISKGGH